MVWNGDCYKRNWKVKINKKTETSASSAYYLQDRKAMKQGYECWHKLPKLKKETTSVQKMTRALVGAI